MASVPTGQARTMTDRHPNTTPNNLTVAHTLRAIAALLTEQDANPFRINAYRRAADTIEGLREDVGEILAREGRDGLDRLPSVGPGIAAVIDEVVSNGHTALLDRLRGQAEPEVVLQRVPGIGPELARVLHETLHVDTLEGLEAAAHDGRLEQVPGIGKRRAAAIRAGLASILGRRAPRRQSVDGPAIGTLLAVDQRYRSEAAAGRLPRIAPRRFNPDGEAWLPILHTDRDGWHFTALFSNTALAHKLNRTRDWVVVYFYDDDHHEGQHTVVTETHGPLRGRRVVRGREAECARYYLQRDGEAERPDADA